MNLKITSIKGKNVYFSGKQSSCFKSGKSVGTRLNSSQSKEGGFIAGIKNSFRSTTRWIKKHANEIIAVLGSLAVAVSGFLWFKRSTSNHKVGETVFSYKSPEVIDDAPKVNEEELGRETREPEATKSNVKEIAIVGASSLGSAGICFLAGNILLPGAGGPIGAVIGIGLGFTGAKLRNKLLEVKYPWKKTPPI